MKQELKIRKSTMNDLSRMLEIYEFARKQMRSLAIMTIRATWSVRYVYYMRIETERLIIRSIERGDEIFLPIWQRMEALEILVYTVKRVSGHNSFFSTALPEVTMYRNPIFYCLCEHINCPESDRARLAD